MVCADFRTAKLAATVVCEQALRGLHELRVAERREDLLDRERRRGCGSASTTTTFVRRPVGMPLTVLRWP